MRTKELMQGVNTERSENPFTMDFGREPNEFIPRLKTMDELVAAFTSGVSPQHIAMITGVRGSGKTVFMTNACKQISEQGNWTTVELSPEQDLLESLVKKLANERTLSKIFQHTQINLSFFGVGFKVEGTPPVSDPEVALERMLESMNKHHRRVLIAIDEVVNNQSMRIFSSIFQILLRKDLPVFLLMTGLFENIRALQDQKTLTFLYRAPRIALMPLNIGIMADRYQSIFQLERNQALQMAKETRGYSFAFQLLGYYTWQYPSEPDRVRSLYKQHLVEYGVVSFERLHYRFLGLEAAVRHVFQHLERESALKAVAAFEIEHFVRSVLWYQQQMGGLAQIRLSLYLKQHFAFGKVDERIEWKSGLRDIRDVEISLPFLDSDGENVFAHPFPGYPIRFQCRHFLCLLPQKYKNISYICAVCTRKK